MGSPLIQHARRQAIKGALDRLVHDVAARMPAALGRHLLYLESQHRLGRFRHPVTFSEKVNWRIMNDRRELIRVSCDKLATKDRARRLGLSVAATLWFGTDLEELAMVRLPERWVLKPNDGCGLVHFGRGPIADVRALRQVTRDWARRSARTQRSEWAYFQARPMLLVEAMLGDGDLPPPDIKVFAFDGEPVLISVDEGRFVDHRRRFYTTEWRALEVRLGGGWRQRPLAPIRARPLTLPLLLDVARAMAQGYDFIRVDLYSVDASVWVGEITPYPGGGLVRFWPRAFDVELGRHWRLPPAAVLVPTPAAGR